jgi:nicotinate-nucleotide--dimethylbenzimidazole phosphoribosyltransferase
MEVTVDRFDRLRASIAQVRAVDSTWQLRAEKRLANLTKPVGSLGRLEWLAARLCGIQQTLSPRATPRRIVVFAADHGVTAEGVSAYPAAVTPQMVSNFLRGGAAINVLARTAGADVCVVDVGVAGRINVCGDAASFVSRPVRAGTRNMTQGAAMTAEELEAAINVGLDVAEHAAQDGVAVLGCGEMGIGNTTAASTITAALARVSAASVTGRGTGVANDVLARKVDAVTRALRVNKPGRDPLTLLRTVGGFEIAALVGAYIGAAAHRTVLIGDGFIATAAAWLAAELCPPFLDYWFAGHRSSEPGHDVQLAGLQQRALLDLDMRLGEGTGAALAMSLFTAAAAVINEMATFDAAGVSESLPEMRAYEHVKT